MYKFKPDFYADVRIEDRHSTTIQYYNGVLQSCKTQNEKKAFIRVYDGEMWYYASTCDVDNIQKELDELYKMAKPCKTIADNPIVKLYQVNKDTKYVFEKNSVRDIPITEKQNRLLESMNKIKSEHLSLLAAMYLDRNSSFEFYSSKGSEIKYDYQLAGEVFSAIFANGAETVQNALSVAGSGFDEVKFSDKEIEDFVNECENFLLNAKPCKQGQFPVVLANIVTGVFAHESFGHKSESDFMLGDETLAKEWTIGKKVGSELLTICEAGEHLGAGYVPYDDEGTCCGHTYLIKNGVLQGRLHSATTAAYLNEGLTGNARAVSCDFEPIVRMTNTYIEAGKSTFEELISGIKFGYYVKSIKHGSGMSTFTLAPLIAYEIVDGKIGDPVRIGVLTGNVFETLGLIDGVGNDFQMLSFVGGGCGKMEQQPLPVGMGGPHIRVSKINVQ